MHERGSVDDEPDPSAVSVPDATSWWYGTAVPACTLEPTAGVLPIVPPVGMPGIVATGVPTGVPATGVPADGQRDPGETMRAANSQTSWDPAALAAADSLDSALPLYRTLLAISRSCRTR